MKCLNQCLSLLVSTVDTVVNWASGSGGHLSWRNVGS